MPTAEQQNEFHAAYQAWIELRTRHDNELRAIVLGEKVADVDHLIADSKVIEVAYKRYMEAGEPFINFGRSFK